MMPLIVNGGLSFQGLVGAILDYRSNAVDNDEAYSMVDAGEKIREALAQIGYAPR
jgi:hypothetical protein